MNIWESIPLWCSSGKQQKKISSVDDYVAHEWEGRVRLSAIF